MHLPSKLDPWGLSTNPLGGGGGQKRLLGTCIEEQNYRMSVGQRSDERYVVWRRDGDFTERLRITQRLRGVAGIPKDCGQQCPAEEHTMMSSPRTWKPHQPKFTELPDRSLPWRRALTRIAGYWHSRT
jgi:hypothetical protein